MAANYLASLHRSRNLSQHFGIAFYHTGIVHHFTQTNNAGPTHRFCYMRGRNFKSGGFQTRGRRRTRRHLSININRLQQRLVMHHAHAIQTQHICDFMGIGKHCGGAMRNDRCGKFCRDQHATFDMHMPVAQTGDQVPPPTIHALSSRPNAVRRIRPDIGKASFGDRNLPTRQYLTGLDINQLALLDNQIRSLFASGHRHKARRDFGPGFKFASFQIFARINRVKTQPRMMLVEL